MPYAGAPRRVAGIEDMMPIIHTDKYIVFGVFLVIPEKEVPQFKQLLVKYCEGEECSVLATFMKERCWKTM